MSHPGNLIVLFACLMAFSAPPEAGTCPPGPNLADTDGDGKFDYACVGDWNNNGTCEMQEDIQTAIYNLTDPGPKLVLLDECSFASPEVGYSSHGIIVLPSNTTLMGSGPGTLLNGFLATDLQSTQEIGRASCRERV